MQFIAPLQALTSFPLEAIVRIFLVFTLTISQFLIVSPIVFYSCFGGLMLWTMLYSRYSRKRGEELRKQSLESQEPVV